MSKLRVLVCEDNEEWRRVVTEIVKRLADDIYVDSVGRQEDALQCVKDNSYQIMIVDLNLENGSVQDGMRLLGEIRRSARNRRCGIIVLTADTNIDNVKLALAAHKASDFIEKASFTQSEFVAILRNAIFDIRLWEAVHKEETCYHLTVSFDEKGLLGSELSGPGLRSNHRQSFAFEVDEIVRRADQINWMITNGGPDVWRRESQAIGKVLNEVLVSERHTLINLAAARAIAQSSSDIWLQFKGPDIGLGIPFELLRDESGDLGLRHVLTRQIAPTAMSRNTGTFRDFFNKLKQNGDQLRVFIVGAGYEDLQAVEQEVRSLERSMQSDLNLLGIPNRIRAIVGNEVSYETVIQALKDDSYHILHFAGHGYHDDALPENSGIGLKEGDGLLTAGMIDSLLRDKGSQMVYLSTCLSARTAKDAARGDFRSLFHALINADVPIVTGFRWEVADEPAMHLAEVFYRELWQTFSPGEAMLQARLYASRELGKDDETWASPVLLMQNP